MGLYCVYSHRNRENGKVYIGITCQNPLKRWKCGNGYIENEHFSRAIKKYGWDAFDHVVIASSLEKADACRMEQELIAKYKSNIPDYGYNKSIGGEAPNRGHKHSEETKRIMSEKKIGVHICDHAKSVLREKAIQRLAAFNPKKGKIGEDCPKSRMIVQMDKNGKDIRVFYGTYDACRKLNLSSPSKIGDVCKGKRKSAYGYIWRYGGGDPVVAV